VQAEVGLEMPAHLLTGLLPRRTGGTPAPPDLIATDELIFRKMKIDPDPLNIVRPRRPRRFVLLDRDFVSDRSPYRELTLCRQTKALQQRATELKEKLLKEKIMKMRRTSNGERADRYH
jgi:hypothetical protein